MENPSLEIIENSILRAVKVIETILQEVRQEDKVLKEVLGMSYAKYVGLSSPFEEAVNALRKVKEEFDRYLSTVRDDVHKSYRSKYGNKKQFKRQRSRWQSNKKVT